MNARFEEARKALRKALIDTYVVEAGLPPDMAQLLDLLSQPAPPPAKRRLFGRLR